MLYKKNIYCGKYKERFLEVSGPSMHHTRPFLDELRKDGNKTVPFSLGAVSLRLSSSNL